MAWEIGPIAPILAPPEEEDLDASLSAGLMRSNHVRVDDPWDVDLLMSLDERQGSDAIPDQRRRFEIQNLGCGLHFAGQPLLYVVASAGQKNARLVDQRRVVLPADAAHARSAAPFDLMQQAGAGSSSENAVAA